MGGYCAICKSYEPIVKSLTVDQEPARRASDVIGHKLKCGHDFGSKDFMEIQKIVNEIKVKGAELIIEIQNEIKLKITKALAQHAKAEVEK